MVRRGRARLRTGLCSGACFALLYEGEAKIFDKSEDEIGKCLKRGTLDKGHFMSKW